MNGALVYVEAAFAAAELARQLTMWASSPKEPTTDLTFDSMSFQEVGAVSVSKSPQGWSVGSIFTPTRQTAPVTWDVLQAGLTDFAKRVAADDDRLGLPADEIRLAIALRPAFSFREIPSRRSSGLVPHCDVAD